MFPVVSGLIWPWRDQVQGLSWVDGYLRDHAGDIELCIRRCGVIRWSMTRDVSGGKKDSVLKVTKRQISGNAVSSCVNV